ncbi:MAG: hypothetical protein AB7F89_09110 [Pirellulaceae bacterium]
MRSSFLACLLAGVGLITLLLVATFPRVARALEDEEIEQRLERLEHLAPAEKDQLRRKYDRFSRLPESEKERLRNLEDSLAEDPQGAAMRDVMRRYHTWLADLSLRQRSDLLQMPPEQRIAEIKSVLASQEALRRQQRQQQIVTSEDLDHILNWIRERADKVTPRLMAELPEKDRQELERMEPRYRTMRLLFTTVHNRKLQNDPLRYESVREISASDREELIRRLSAPAQDAYRRTTTDDEQRKLLQSWFVSAVMRSVSRGMRWGREYGLRFLDIEAPGMRDQLYYRPLNKPQSLDAWRRDDRGRPGFPPGRPPGGPDEKRGPPFFGGGWPDHLPRSGKDRPPPRPGDSPKGSLPKSPPPASSATDGFDTPGKSPGKQPSERPLPDGQPPPGRP